MTMRRTVAAAALRREPHLVWNAFIDLLALEDYDDLSPLQRKAHLVFWYESEVQNGGHGQYFENQGCRRLREAIAALCELGLACQAAVLSRAADILDAGTAFPEGLAEELDRAFHACAPSATAALERHLATHQDDYVSIV